MKRHIFLILFSTFILFFSACNQKQTDIIFDNAYQEEIKLTQKEVANFFVRNYIPGGNIAVAKDNKIIYSEGVGLASKDLQVKMTRKHILRIGEVSQLFTSAIYLQLVEKGVLNPDSSVQHYLPSYPKTTAKIAIKHLTFHTSGIRKEDKNENHLSGQNLTLQKGLDLFKNDALTSQPGMFEEVSMFNLNLLGAVMEKATNKHFFELVQEYICDTLNLSHTVVDNPFSTVVGRSDFFDENLIGQVQNAPFVNNRFKAPAKGILSNAEDLVKFGMAIMDSEYFSDEFRAKLFEPCDLFGAQKSSMANGWVLALDENGREVNGRSGSVTGGGATLILYPKEKLVIAYAVNLTLDNNMLPVMQIGNYFLKDSK